jgi:hypothetical protein
VQCRALDGMRVGGWFHPSPQVKGLCRPEPSQSFGALGTQLSHNSTDTIRDFVSSHVYCVGDCQETW